MSDKKKATCLAPSAIVAVCRTCFAAIHPRSPAAGHAQLISEGIALVAPRDEGAPKLIDQCRSRYPWVRPENLHAHPRIGQGTGAAPQAGQGISVISGALFGGDAGVACRSRFFDRRSGSGRWRCRVGARAC